MLTVTALQIAFVTFSILAFCAFVIFTAVWYFDRFTWDDKFPLRKKWLYGILLLAAYSLLFGIVVVFISWVTSW